MTTPENFPATLKNKLIVSCQALPGDPLDHLETLRRMAISVLRGGAGGLRANGADAIAAMRRETTLPIIGISKRFDDGKPDITPDFASAKSISDAGADIVGLDCSAGRFPTSEPWRPLLTRIRQELRRPVLADIATLEEALAAEQAGADAVATTMFGYTPETAGQRSINWTLVENLVKSLHLPVIVEGHVRQPDEVRRSFDLGAYAVVVGAAITQPEAITARFIAGMQS
ncbi:putative N-acetylmannosamine-6-phosphate 2-epimerase [Alloacidobacterium dinghuense]|uniref:N-acylglucosamine-6-phosphate 2-epimerase n=1 Tax=Alloacidobacterium dinghuense TaxID=2763107 RepID=A0A7G8BHN1_9BACT|nr:putative N-acetylmannosamine-6-phosphate 2-epimerase [Alloacidobacterium dinghuense]QNI32051.1 putative N-acetylmannosamine-6-phosphate 2-epimerase [Alloacidobacterium dinghuense]